MSGNFVVDGRMRHLDLIEKAAALIAELDATMVRIPKRDRAAVIDSAARKLRDEDRLDAVEISFSGGPSKIRTSAFIFLVMGG